LSILHQSRYLRSASELEHTGEARFMVPKFVARWIVKWVWVKNKKPLNMKSLCSFLSSIYVYMYTFCNTVHPCFTICVIRLWELWWHHND
jgi:hypothetical protein